MADKVKKRYLFPEDFMADPSVHVFDGKLYIYPSHDWESAAPDDDFGSEYDMKDYHVLSLEGPDPMTSPVKDNGVALDIKDVPWARRQLWDNEVVKGRDGKYYMYFPAKDKTDIFPPVPSRPCRIPSAAAIPSTTPSCTMTPTTSTTCTSAASGAASSSATRTTSPRTTAPPIPPTDSPPSRPAW